MKQSQMKQPLQVQVGCSVCIHPPPSPIFSKPLCRPSGSNQQNHCSRPQPIGSDTESLSSEELIPSIHPTGTRPSSALELLHAETESEDATVSAGMSSGCLTVRAGTQDPRKRSKTVPFVKDSVFYDMPWSEVNTGSQLHDTLK